MGNYQLERNLMLFKTKFLYNKIVNIVLSAHGVLYAGFKTKFLYNKIVNPRTKSES